MPQSNIKIFLPTQKKPCAYFQSPSNLDLDIHLLILSF